MHGNIHWDKNFDNICDFILSSLVKSSVYTQNEKSDIENVLKHFKTLGYRANIFYNEKIDIFEFERITGVEAEFENIFNMDFNIYKIIEDYIGKLYKYKNLSCVA